MNLYPFRCSLALMAMVGAVISCSKQTTDPMEMTSLPGDTVLNVNYESGTLSSGVTGISSTHASAVDANYMVQPGAKGSYAIAHKVVYGDTAYYSDGAYRSESDAVALPAARFAPGDERRYEFSVLLKDWTPWLSGAIHETNIFQLKVSGNSTTGSGVPLQVRVARNALRLRYADNIRVYNFLADVRPYINQWIHFRIDAKWTLDATGYIRTYMKLPGHSFTIVDEKTNYATFAGNPAVGNIGYIKWGIYGIQEGLTRIAYHDDIRIIRLN
ncbi:heparin lyase I family protein [Pedobacter frigoris]|uniref:heparin lyase I family protein n=1 Tax=Pedobacter frigoris TaxID=2571272 RepID=UPI00292F21A7|nr:heparin lyase I family protein [Pedobacter frigoris]